MVLRGPERERVVAVREGEERDLLAHEELLDDHGRPRRAEGPALHAEGDGVVGLRERAADDRAFAGGEPVGLDHQGRAEIAAVAPRARRIVEGREARGGDPVARQQGLRERLRALDRRGSRGRAEDA